jgi:Zn-dependent protease
LWIPLLRLGSIRIYVDGLVLILFALLLMGWGRESSVAERLGLFGIALGSVLLHELGHAVMAHRRGLAVGGVFLHLVPFAYVERGSPSDELRTALAGPVTNLLIAGALFAVPHVREGFPWLELGRWLDDPLWTAFGINVLMGVLNLLPALPADGGRVLRAALLLKLPPAKAYALTARVGTFTGAACFFVAVLLWPKTDAYAAAVAGVFVIMVAWREARQGQLERRKERAKARDAAPTASSASGRRLEG